MWRPLCRHPLTYDPELMLKGLALLYEMNSRPARRGRRLPAPRRGAHGPDPAQKEECRMKLGIVGSGKIVQEFLPWLVQAPTVEVAALCSTERSAEKAAALCRQYGVPLHVTDYGRLLEAVDTVYIALPNLLHTAYAKAALEAGRNAIVEKPLAPCAAEAARLAALARSKGLYLFEAVTTQYLPNYRKLQGLLPGWARSRWCSAASASIPAGTTRSWQGRPPLYSTRTRRGAP